MHRKIIHTTNFVSINTTITASILTNKKKKLKLFRENCSVVILKWHQFWTNVFMRGECISTQKWFNLRMHNKNEINANAFYYCIQTSVLFTHLKWFFFFFWSQFAVYRLFFFDFVFFSTSMNTKSTIRWTHLTIQLEMMVWPNTVSGLYKCLSPWYSRYFDVKLTHKCVRRQWAHLLSEFYITLIIMLIAHFEK